MPVLINILAFQVSWFAAVLSAANDQAWLGMMVMLTAIALHLGMVRRPLGEFLLVLCCGVIGAIWDSLLVAKGLVSYTSGMIAPQLAPYWIVGMWMLFATTLNLSMGWLRQRPCLAILFGAVGGPLAYVTGQKLGGIVLTEPTPALLALAVGWGAMMPLLISLATRFDGVSVVAGARRAGAID
jgi:Protein of unknown function (DUF2878)